MASSRSCWGYWQRTHIQILAPVDCYQFNCCATSEELPFWFLHNLRGHPWIFENQQDDRNDTSSARRFGLPVSWNTFIDHFDCRFEHNNMKEDRNLDRLTVLFGTHCALIYRADARGRLSTLKDSLESIITRMKHHYSYFLLLRIKL